MLTKGSLVKMGLRVAFQKWNSILPVEKHVSYSEYLEYIITKGIQDAKIYDGMRQAVQHLPDTEF